MNARKALRRQQYMTQAELAQTMGVTQSLAAVWEQIDWYGSLEAGLQAYHNGHDTGARWYAHAVLAAAEHWR